MELERRLAELRKEKNVSQEEIAEKLYVSRQTISNWERGKTYPDINFFNPEKKVKINFFREVWFVFSLLTVTWLIFFVGVVVSTLVFY